jgi:hypothetical protein
LGDFDGVRQTIAEVVGEGGGKDLSLLLHAPEGTGVNDPVAITLKWIAVRMLRLRTAPASTL